QELGTAAGAPMPPPAAEDFAVTVADLRGEVVYAASLAEPGAAWTVALGDGRACACTADRDAIGQALAALAARGANLVGHDLTALVREFAAVLGEGGFDVGLASYLCDPEAGDHSREDVCGRFLGEPAAEPSTSAEFLDQIGRVAKVLQAQ